MIQELKRLIEVSSGLRKRDLEALLLALTEMSEITIDTIENHESLTTRQKHHGYSLINNL